MISAKVMVAEEPEVDKVLNNRLYISVYLKCNVLTIMTITVIISVEYY